MFGSVCFFVSLGCFSFLTEIPVKPGLNGLKAGYAPGNIARNNVMQVYACAYLGPIKARFSLATQAQV